MKKILLSSSLIFLLPFLGKWNGIYCDAQIINTIAGTGTLGYNGDGIPATSAWFNYPAGVAVDAAGNIYITDMNNCRLRKIDVSTGLISTIAGTGIPGFSGDGGPATSAQLSNYVIGVTLDSSGNIYIADGSDNCIRKINKSTGIISTLAGSGSFSGGYSGDGGLATASQLNYPVAVAISPTGFIYIADCYNHRIRKINVSTGIITTAAGTGIIGSSGDGGLATAAKLNYPAGVACDEAGNVYISDNENNKIRKITVSTGIINTIAGTGAAGATGDGGLATSAKLRNPQGIIVDVAGDIFFADGLNYRIRKITVSTGIISKIAGTTMGFSGDGGLATSAQLNNANGIALDAAGNLYMADAANQRIRKITPAPLPVELISFSGENKNNINYLHWATASEINNDYFNVERSSDGIDFENIETIKGHGNSNQLLNYYFNDVFPFSGINYYRLKQVDYNGEFQYSNVIAVQNNSGETPCGIYSDGSGNFILDCNEIQNGILIIYDMHGKVIQQEQINSISSNIKIDSGKNGNGIYFVRFINKQRTKSFKILKN